MIYKNKKFSTLIVVNVSDSLLMCSLQSTKNVYKLECSSEIQLIDFQPNAEAVFSAV